MVLPNNSPRHLRLDVNAPPTLIEVTKDGKKIPAVAQSTKLGLLFILDRFTGKAIFGDEERPVPDTDAPGDHASPTQPFPLKPEPISRIAMTREEVSKISPETRRCAGRIRQAVQMGPYTPYGMVPTLVFPSSEGGGSWSGASFDPGLGYIFVNTRSVGTLAKLNPQHRRDSAFLWQTEDSLRRSEWLSVQRSALG